MNDIENFCFQKPGVGTLSLRDIMIEIHKFICENPREYYRVIVGSDTSARHPEPCTAAIISVVIVWRIGKGAIYFWTQSAPQRFHARRERIIGETMASLTLAQEIRSRLKDTVGEEFMWDGNEVHADVGNEGESRAFVKEVTGLIRGFDFEPVIKPEAWCASTVADRHT